MIIFLEEIYRVGLEQWWTIFFGREPLPDFLSFLGGQTMATTKPVPYDYMPKLAAPTRATFLDEKLSLAGCGPPAGRCEPLAHNYDFIVISPTIYGVIRLLCWRAHKQNNNV